MLRFLDLSIKRKLTFVIVATCSITLTFACLTYIVYDQLTLKQSIVRHARVLARIIGENSCAMLVKHRSEDVQKILSALDAEEHILIVCLYNANGNPIATYTHRALDSQFTPPAPPSHDEYRFDDQSLHLFQRIHSDNTLSCTVYLRSDLGEIRTRLKQLIGIIVGFIVISILVILAISAKVQKVISEPIIQLTNVAKEVSATDDYSLRATKLNQDELGFLTEAFNDMLTKIRGHDVALQNAQQELKTRAKELQLELTERILAEKQLTESLAEKEVLLKEVHHRVKNNLQIISSLFYLQLKNTKDQAIIQLLRESQNRVKAMALIHEKLYNSKDVSKIDFSKYVRSLARHLLQTYCGASEHIVLDFDIDDMDINIDKAIQCGLIINELVSNSLKHAFPDNRKGSIHILFHCASESGYVLKVSDDGVSLPEMDDFCRLKSLGLQLVCNLTEQLEGTIELSRERGTAFSISFN